MATLWKIDPESNLIEVRVPTGLLVNENCLDLILLQELTGEEEDILASKSIPALRKMSMVLTNCIRQIGDITDRNVIRAAVDDLPSGDRQALIIALRRLSLENGHMYEMQARCDNCSKETGVTADLDSYPVDMPADPRVRTFDDALPAGGKFKKFRWAVLDGHREQLLEAIEKVVHDESGVTTQILGRLVSVDDHNFQIRADSKGGIRDAVAFVKKLRHKDLEAMRRAFAKHEGGLDLTTQWTCKHCGAEHEGMLDIAQPGFFFPSVTSKR